VHALPDKKAKTHKKIKFGAHKLDLVKAYGRIDWNYHEGILEKLGFDVYHDIC
jgi:hypothetical protein